MSRKRMSQYRTMKDCEEINGKQNMCELVLKEGSNVGNLHGDQN
jgi:hypothetical protein